MTAVPGVPGVVVVEVSVIVAARNAGATLARALDSLLAQSDGRWQALIVDNGSSDDTAQVVARYAARDARFIALHSATHGASAARNAGLAQAQGRRVLFLDSDDWIDGRFLALMNAALDAAPGAVAACCNHRRVMADDALCPVQSSARAAADPVAAFAATCAAAIHTVLVERELVLRVGGFDTALRTCEDWDLWQRVARAMPAGSHWVHVDEALSFYSSAGGSLSHDLRQLLGDAAVVIERGFQAPAARAHRNSPQQALAFFALWCAAVDCGRGGSGAAFLPTVQPLAPESSPQDIADTLLLGLMLGQRAVPERLAARWPAYGAQVTALIDALGATWQDTVASRRVQYVFERLLLAYDDLAAPRPLSLTLGLRVDLHRPTALTPPGHVDRVLARLCDGAAVLHSVELGVLGTVTTRQWLDLATQRLGFKPVARAAAVSVARALTPQRLGAGLRASAAVLRHDRSRGALKTAARRAFFDAAGAAREPLSHDEALQQLRAQAQAVPAPSAATAAAADAPAPQDPNTPAYWEHAFRRRDPWHYDSAYEQEKYARQLQLVPAHVGTALELACAEGRFTALLAPRVQHLIATDIAPTAVERAAERCSAQRNIEFRTLHLVADPLPPALDLIVCSEVLYYLRDRAELDHVARRLAAALAPGGCLLIAHALLLVDEPSRTGFDWGHPFGAQTIGAAFAATPGLVLERSIRTELYRIDRFARRDAAAAEASIDTVAVAVELEPDVARHLVRGGVVTRRADVQGERRDTVPMLAYHRVADSGPPALARWRVGLSAFEAQLRWLRRHGYYALDCAQLAWHLEHRQPFVGRPLALTFDDGTQDFADAAWPLLRQHDFGAHVFVVTDLVGGVAEWDRRWGEPARLMDAATIADLAAEGVRFGSHLASHRGADGLSTLALAQELLRSRAAVQRWSGQTVTTFAAPFGASDERLRVLAHDCGYALGFGTESRRAQLRDDRFNLPRLEVRGDMALDEFAATMQACR